MAPPITQGKLPPHQRPSGQSAQLRARARADAMGPDTVKPLNVTNGAALAAWAGCRHTLTHTLSHVYPHTHMDTLS